MPKETCKATARRLARAEHGEGTIQLAVAARADHLGFNTITGTIRTETWEAPVTRWEVGGGYSVIRNVQLRTTFQHNARDGGRVRQMTAIAAQLLYWF